MRTAVYTCHTCGERCSTAKRGAGASRGYRSVSTDDVLLCEECHELFVIAGLLPFVPEDARVVQQALIDSLTWLKDQRKRRNKWGVGGRVAA